LDGRFQELDARLVSEEQYLADGRLSVVAPISGVVWSSSLADGSVVAPGETALEIVDPRRLTIEAIFKEAAAERIRPGEPVKARLLGSSRILHGRVVRVAAPGAIDQGTIGMVARDRVDPGTFRAIIALDERPAGADAGDRSYIGRSALVWAPRWPLDVMAKGRNEGRRE
jgi:multidrug efflux pump subunit AcrA (membrane-fusion protein)